MPYVSRLLKQLDREALIQRGPRGLVVDVDVPNLLRRRAETYALYGTNESHSYLSGTGAREVVRQMRDNPAFPYRAVAGSFAAVQRAPIAAPSQLTVYVDDLEATAQAMSLMPTDQGADVVLLRPSSRSVSTSSMVCASSRRASWPWTVCPATGACLLRVRRS